MMLRFRSLWRNLVWRSRVDRDLDDELSATVDALVQEKMQRGMTAHEARRAARLELGSVESIKEQVRDVRAGALLATLLQDVRYACRLLARSPGFTATAVITLTLGIGANTAIFSVLDELLLRHLPVEEPQRLVIFAGDESRTWKSQVSYPLYTQLRDRNDVLSGLIALNGTSLVLDTDGSVERISGEIVSGNYFSVLGLKAALGRTFLPEEDRVPGAHAVAVISHGLWRRRFGSDPGVVSKNVRLNGYSFTVIGVAPEGFAGTSPGRRADIFVPVMMLGQIFPLEAPKLTQSGNNWLNLMGRLNPGTSRAQAQASLGQLATRLQQDIGNNARKRVFLDGGGHGNNDGVQKLARPVTFLAGTAALVLAPLVSCDSC